MNTLQYHTLFTCTLVAKISFNKDHLHAYQSRTDCDLVGWTTRVPVQKSISPHQRARFRIETLVLSDLF
ncbi:hypothetical protein Hanom_Chr06g00565601 [Helianthus anomalus]